MLAGFISPHLHKSVDTWGSETGVLFLCFQHLRTLIVEIRCLFQPRSGSKVGWHLKLLCFIGLCFCVSLCKKSLMEEISVFIATGSLIEVSQKARAHLGLKRANFSCINNHFLSYLNKVKPESTTCYGEALSHGLI